MLELLKRMSALLDNIGMGEEVRPGTVEASSLTSRDWARLRGMRDLVVAMEERAWTLRKEVARWPAIVDGETSERLTDLWEKA